jgi:hypothetical protein
MNNHVSNRVEGDGWVYIPTLNRGMPSSLKLDYSSSSLSDSIGSGSDEISDGESKEEFGRSNSSKKGEERRKAKIARRQQRLMTLIHSYHVDRKAPLHLSHFSVLDHAPLLLRKDLFSGESNTNYKIKEFINNYGRN